MTNLIPVLSVVVPCFNEEEVLTETIKRLDNIFNLLIKDKLISNKSYILFVDDGSKDRTWDLIQQYRRNNKFVKGLKLARNAGHQNALLAGLMRAKENSDCTISIDADLQDDVNVIRDFILKFHEGYDVVYGVRNNRDKDTIFKRVTAQGFYRFMDKMGVNIVYNHADFRLMSRRALYKLELFEERNLFLRGIIPLIGFKSTQVHYVRNERFAGDSKYPLKKMLSFALNGITSFSVTPIRFVTSIGFIIFLLSFVFGIYAVVSKLIGHSVSGWASIMVSLWFIGGIQLMSLGLIGEYVGKIYQEVKGRPMYIVEEEIGLENYENLELRNDIIYSASVL